MISTLVTILLTVGFTAAASITTLKPAIVSAYYVPPDELLTFTFTPAFYPGITQQYVDVGVVNSAGAFFQLAKGLTSPDTSVNGQYETTPQGNVTATFDFIATGFCGVLTLEANDTLIAGSTYPVGSQQLTVPCPTGTPHTGAAKGHGSIATPVNNTAIAGAEPAVFSYTPQAVNTRSVDIIATDRVTGAQTIFAHGLAKPSGAASSAVISNLFIPLAAGCNSDTEQLTFTEHRIENDGTLSTASSFVYVTLSGC